MPFTRQCLVAGLTAALLASASPPPAHACSGPPAHPPVGIPRSGSTGVSTATSIIVLSQSEPTGLVLQAAGQDVPLGRPYNLGMGGTQDVGNRIAFWQVRPAAANGLLVPSAEHVLTAKFDGSTVEVTRFTTADGYEKMQGTAPVARALHLWRVRYPLSDITSGNCVFSEYHGFLTVDYDPGTVPNTPASSVVHTFLLQPKTGGSAQTFNYVGETPFAGLAPSGDHPLPMGDWQPELDPTREYCLTISAFGDGDIGRLALTSQLVCASVVQLSASGAPPSPEIGGGGCSVSAASGAASDPWGPFALILALALALRRRMSHRLVQDRVA